MCGWGWGLHPFGSRSIRRQGAADDRELTFRANGLFVGRERKVDAEPVVARTVVDRRAHLDAVATSHEPHDRLQMDARELGLDQKLAHEVVVSNNAARDRVSATSRTVGTERVEISGVRLVLDDVQAREAATGAEIGDGERPVCCHVDREMLGGRRKRLRQACLEATELDEHAASVHLDETATTIRQRVDERAAATECLARDHVDRAIELLVPHEHVAVDFVARAAAD